MKLATRVNARVSAPRPWPLFLIGAPAAVAVWSGWVGLGSLCGFGLIHPLPGIVPGFQLNTAITLPIGVEAYGAYALGAWLRTGGATGAAASTARAFAKSSAIGALTLGCLGQVVYHLLAAAHAARAPWPVVAFVSCLPVISLAFGAALAHLERAAAESRVPEPDPDRVPADVPGWVHGVGWVPEAGPVPEGAPIAMARVPEPPVPGPVPEVPEPEPMRVPAEVPEPEPMRPRRTRTEDRPAAVTEASAEGFYSGDLALGRVPGVKRIRADLHVGQARAQALRDHLKSVASGEPGQRPVLHAVPDIPGVAR